MTGALAKSSTIHSIIQDCTDEWANSPHYLIFDTGHKPLDIQECTNDALAKHM